MWLFSSIVICVNCPFLPHRFISYIWPDYGMSDNDVVNIYPVGKQLVASSETDFVHTFDPETLEERERVRVNRWIIAAFLLHCPPLPPGPVLQTHCSEHGHRSPTL